MQRYLVGGAVRDHLLGRKSKDKDWVVVGSTPDEMISLGFQQVGADFPVFLHPKTKEEHALARMERKSGKGYTGFICDFSPDVTLEQDLIRRDLTINAMAMTESGEIIDPFNGQFDLKNRFLRHVSQAFIEDPLRVLRVARFAARLQNYPFHIAPETCDLMIEITDSGELESLTAERVWQETWRALQEQHASTYFQVLDKCRALNILFPELSPLFNSTTVGSNNSSTLSFLDQVSPQEPEKRFAILTHGLPAEHDEGLQQHAPEGVNLINSLCSRLKAPKAIRELAIMVRRFYYEYRNIMAMPACDVLNLLDQSDVWRREDRFRQFLSVCEELNRMQSSASKHNSVFFNTIIQDCKSITAQPLVEQGFKGLELKAQLQGRRLQAIEMNLKSNS